MSIKYTGKGQASDNLLANNGHHPCCNGPEFPALRVPRQLGLQNGESGERVEDLRMDTKPICRTER